jgi:hypothetical protein
MINIIKPGAPALKSKSVFSLVRYLSQQTKPAVVPAAYVITQSVRSVGFKYQLNGITSEKRNTHKKVSCICNGRHINFKENVVFAVIYIK